MRGEGGKVQGLNLPRLTFFSQTNILFKNVIEQSLISIVEKFHLSISLILPVSSHSRLSAISSSSSYIHKFPAMSSHSSEIQSVLAVPAMSSHYEPFTSIIIHSRHFKQHHEPRDSKLLAQTGSFRSEQDHTKRKWQLQHKRGHNSWNILFGAPWQFNRGLFGQSLGSLRSPRLRPNSPW